MAKKKTEIVEEVKKPEIVTIVPICAVNLRYEPTLESQVRRIVYVSDAFEAYAEPVDGFYKLTNGDGFISAEFVVVK